jgi:glycosyltransferase involved in cell wall biosynthesis
MPTRLPVFSIVIPTLNEERYLPILLKDIDKQTFRSFEVIVADGHSEDRTVDRCQKFSRRFPLTIVNSKVRNVSAQRNSGAEKAHGTWIIFFDADNRIAPDFLAAVNRQIVRQRPDLFTCWAKCDSDDAMEQAVISFYNIDSDVARFVGSAAALGAMIGIRRDAFSTIGGFDPSVGFAEDREFVRQATEIRGLRFSVFHKPTYIYNLRRMRKMGAIPFILKSSLLFEKYQRKRHVDQPVEYPMGGHVFTGSKNRKLKSSRRVPIRA